MRTFASKNSKLNMCDYCFNTFSNCKPTVLDFGDGIGNDNVIACSEYVGRPHKDIEIDTKRGVAPTLCPHCNCRTKTFKKMCGKCGEKKRG